MQGSAVSSAGASLHRPITSWKPSLPSMRSTTFTRRTLHQAITPSIGRFEIGWESARKCDCGITVFHVMNACFVLYFAFENNVKGYGQACPFPGSILDNHSPHGKNRLTIRHYEGNKIPLSHYLFFPVPFQTQTVLFRLPTLWTKLHIHTTMQNPTFKGICNVDYWNIISLI